jgi:hypothetical protein
MNDDVPICVVNKMPTNRVIAVSRILLLCAVLGCSAFRSSRVDCTAKSENGCERPAAP